MICLISHQFICKWLITSCELQCRLSKILHNFNTYGYICPQQRGPVHAHQGQVIGQCPTWPGYVMSVPIRGRLYVSAQQGQVILCQCPSGLCYIMSVPITHQGQVTCQGPTGPGYIMSVHIRARLHVSAHQGQVSVPGYMSVPSRANNVAGVVYLRVTASIAVVSAPHQSTNIGLNIPHGCAC